MAKLIYENGRFYKKSNGKLIQVNKYGIPINKADQISSTTKKDETSLVGEVVDAATTKEGMGTIGGAAVGGWFGSSMGIVALGTGIAGTLPVAIVGGVVGFLMVKAFGDDDKKKKKKIKI
jgi:hypothetical protein